MGPCGRKSPVLKVARDKMWSAADENNDSLWISMDYLWISDHCRVTIRVGVRVRVNIEDCCVQTAGKSDLMQINHASETDQWRATPQIHPAPHFVVSR